MANKKKKEKISKHGSMAYSLDIRDKHFLNTPKQKKQLINNIRENNVELQEYTKRTFKKGIFSERNYLKKFSITGSLIIDNLDELGLPCKDFFLSKRGRYFEVSNSRGKAYILRGPRYLMALKPHLSVPLKLEMLYDDIKDGADALIKIDNYNVKQHYEIYPILDYLKNALVTIYNAYTHQEKFKHLVQLEKEDCNYTNLKNCILEILEEVVFCCYLSLINEFDSKFSMKLIQSIGDEELFNKIFDSISNSFKSFIFSSRAIVRPEASHPIVIAAFCHRICSKYSDVDFIFGLPAGGTEIACLIHKHMEYVTGQKKELILIPISMHSLKRHTKHKIEIEEILKIFPQFSILSKKKGILVDDNSSSGKTIGEASYIIKKVYKNIDLKCRVAEADTIRAELRFMKREENCKIANQILFQDAIGILPVSKKIKPKYDLKELVENNYLSNHYMSFLNDENDLIKKIKLLVIIDAIHNKFEDTYSERKEFLSENHVSSFKGTFLSNFHPVVINKGNRKFSSVEHAYCFKKYDIEIFKSLEPQQKKELNEILSEKGLDTVDDFSFIFESNFPAGAIKRISNKLKSWGFEKKDGKEWDECRLDIMIDLLIKKFSQFELATQLLQTENKELIEGNDWNDTFWGVCNIDGVQRGHNFLGRILFVIRDKIRSDEIRVNGYKYNDNLNKLIETKKIN